MLKVTLPQPKWKSEPESSEYELVDGTMTIGRCLMNTVRLARPNISPVHLILSTFSLCDICRVQQSDKHADAEGQQHRRWNLPAALRRGVPTP